MAPWRPCRSVAGLSRGDHHRTLAQFLAETGAGKLHDIVQVVMGWMDSHLQQFVTQDETHYAPLSPYGDPDWGERVSNSGKVRLHDVLPAEGVQLL